MRIVPNRDYRLLLGGGIISQLGDWAARFALALLVFEKTGSATAVGLVGALIVLPWLGPGQWLATKGDRADRRRLLVACDLVRGLIFLLIGLGDLPLGVLLLLVLVSATIDPVFEANRSALLADVVDLDEYADAIRLDRALDQVAQLAGLASGGILVSALSAANSLAVNGLTFLASGVVLSTIRHRSEGTTDRVAPRLGDAWEYLRQDKLALVGLSMTLGTVFASMSVQAQAVVYGTLVAGLSGSQLGLLAATVPAATLTAIAAVPSSGDDSSLIRRGALVALWAAVPGALALPVEDRVDAAFIGYALVGVVLVQSTTANMAIGRRIPADRRGTTFAVLQAAVFISGSLGMFAGGAVSELSSPRIAASGAFVLVGVVSAAGIVALQRIGRKSYLRGTKVTA